MLKKYFNKLNKRAFTLIEIVLAIALLAVASVAIGAVIISTQNNTAQMFNESELQQQLVEVQETIHNEILATNAGIKYWVQQDEDGLYVSVDKDSGGEYEKVVAFYNLDIQDFILSKTYYRYNSEDKIMQVASLEQQIPKDRDNRIPIVVDNDIAATLASIDDWTVVAACLEEFTLDLTNYEKNKLVSYAVSVEQDDVAYPTEDTVYIRNDIDVNKDLTLEDYHVISLAKPTIEDTYFVYDGNEHGPKENYFEKYVVKTEDSVVVAKNAGTYTITYRLKDKDATQWEDGTTADVIYTWTIGKRTVGLIWGTTSWVYDGDKHSTTCTATNLIQGDTCEILLSNNSVGEDVGTAVVTARTGNPNYTVPAMHSATLSITSTPTQVTVETLDHVYTGAAQSMATWRNLVGGTLRFYISTSDVTPTKEQVSKTECTAVNAGTYHIWYRVVASNNNYSDSDVTYLGTATMSKAAGAITLSASQGTYTYPTKGTFTATSNSGGTLSVQSSDNKIAVVSVSGDTVTVAPKTIEGTATITINLAETPNYTSASVTYSATVEHGTLSVTAQGYSGVYDGDPHGIEVKCDGAKITYSTVSNGVYVTTNPTYTDVGEYKVYYKVEQEGYHTATGNRTVKITKANGSCTAPTAKTLTYNGESQILINAGSSDTGTMCYKIGANGVYSTELPSAINADTYTVYYYSKGDMNHKDTAEKSINVTIAKATGSITLSATSGTITYPKTGSFTAKGNSDGALTVESSDTNIATANINNGTVTITPGATAGTTNITIRLAATNNCTAATATYTVTVNPGWLSVVASGYSGAYDGKAHGITVECDGATITYSTDGKNYSSTNPTYTNVSTTDVYYKVEKAGYTTVTGMETVKIAKANGSVKLSATSGTLVYPASGEFTIDENLSGGALSIVNSHPNVATVSRDGKTVTMKSGTTAGTTTITVTSAATDNYHAASATYTLTVKSGVLSVVAEGYGGTYDGKAHGITVTCTGAKITYSTLENGTYSTTNPTFTNAGTYTVYYKVEREGYATVTDHSTVVIEKAKGVITMSATSGTIVYPATSNFTVSSNSGGTLSVKSSNTDIATVGINNGTVTVASGPTEGTATITVSLAETTNYTAASATYTASVNHGIAAIPAQKGTLTYTGGAQSPSWNDYDTAKMTISGETSKTDAGTYTATFTLKAGYKWSDGTKTAKNISWTIQKAAGSIVLSPANGTITYPTAGQFTVISNSDGKLSVQSSNTALATVSINNSTVTVTPGTTEGTAVITVNLEATTNYTAASKTYTATIQNQAVPVPTQKGTLTYTGSAQSPAWNNYNQTAMTIGGTTNSTNAGSYTAKFTLKAGYKWSDNTRTDKNVPWSIKKATGSITLSVISGTLTYPTADTFTATSNFGTPTVSSSDTKIATVSKSGTTVTVTPGTTEGTAIITVSLAGTNNYTAASKTYTAVVQNGVVPNPFQNGTLTYNGKTQSPVWNGYDANKMTIGGTTSAVNAGVYTATFTPKAGYKWVDNTKTAKDANWMIGRATIAVPTQSGTLTYNGSEQSPSWNGYDTTQMTIGSTQSATNAGTYTATFTPTSNYQWSDKSVTGKDVTWKIEKAAGAITLSATSGTITYPTTGGFTASSNSGGALTVASSNTNVATVSINSGTVTIVPGTTEGTATITVNLDATANYTAASKTYTVTVYNGIAYVPAQSGALTYNGKAQSPAWNNNYDTAKMTISGETSKTNAGTYTATFTLKAGYKWSDKSVTAKNVNWVIGKAAGSITLSATSGTITYPTTGGFTASSNSGGALTVASSNTNIATVSINSGTVTITPGTTAGTATITVNLEATANYTAASKTYAVTVNNGIAYVPTQSGTLTYNGNAQSPSWTNYDTNKMTISGETSKTNAGTYTATFTLKAGYKWSDGTTAAKNVSWTIGRAVISVPTQKGSLTYSGSAQSPSWSGYDTNKMTIGGETSKTNAGTYTATFTPTSNYKWNDNTTGAKNASWVIGKAAGSITLSATSGTITYPTAGTFTATSNSGGALSVDSANDSIATASISGSTVTVTPGTTAGTVKITVSLAATTNYTAASATYSVTVSCDLTAMLYSDGAMVFQIGDVADPAHGDLVAKYTGWDTAKYTSESAVPWYSKRESVKSVVVKDTIKPASTAYWFYEFTNCASMDLTKLDVSSVNNMSYMFAKAGRVATTFNITGIHNWNVSAVQNMDHMFYYAGSGSTTWSIGDISKWNVSSVKDMGYMFSNAGASTGTTFNLGNLNNWNVSSVTDMNHLFHNAGSDAETWNVGNLSNWVVSSVQDMSTMFCYAGHSSTTWSVGDLNKWNVSSVKDMSDMFSLSGCEAETWSVGDLSAWNVSSVTDMSDMFYSSGKNATTWGVGNLSQWNVSSVKTMAGMFKQAGHNAKTWSVGDLSTWNVSSVTDMNNMFNEAGYNSTTFSLVGLDSWNVSSVNNMYAMFWNVGNNATTWSIGDLSNWNVSSVTNMNQMFASSGCDAPTWGVGDISKWDVSSVTQMSNMFAYAGYNSALFTLDLSG